MRLILAKIGDNQTVSFAVNEIARLIKKMDPTLALDIRKYASYDTNVRSALWVGLNGAVPENKTDTIHIDVENGAGVITASNNRGVLIAAYRFMYELGCRFLYPGADGEKIPMRTLAYGDVKAHVHETASYSHRTVCLEGAAGYEHIYNMLDWLPKVGMCGYFVQLITPSDFFKRYYRTYYNNPDDRDYQQVITPDEVNAIMSALTEEIEKRDLVYHAVGHGWTAAAVGLDYTGWGALTEDVSEKVRGYLAQVNGERTIQGSPLTTELCYSNPVVRNKMTDCILAYCKAHPEVDYLHFWLSDIRNKQCECEECQKKLPSDFYVMMLNELDEKLTAAGLNTKVVYLIYCDLLYAPKTEKLKNPDRFVLMFAPIARSFSESYADVSTDHLPEFPPYQRNKVKAPKTLRGYLSVLDSWYAANPVTDSFVFDYHLMWDHHTDPGYYATAKLLQKDMTCLDKLGLDGMVSCQLQRLAVPTGLPQYCMVQTLWNKNKTFDEIKDEYFSTAFGADAAAVEQYLATLSDLFDPPFVRGEKKLSGEAVVAQYSKIHDVVNAFDAAYLQANADKSADWQYLAVHAHFVHILADMYIARYSGDEVKASELADAFRAYEDETAHITDAVLDNVFVKGDVTNWYWKRHAPEATT